MSIGYDGKKIPFAKALRKNATPQENHLWYDFLRMYPIRFQRQKAIDNFIVDYYCHQAGLIVEIDGSQHFTDAGLQADAFRTDVLEKYHLKVIRVSNHDVNTKFRSVCAYIDAFVKARLSERKKEDSLSRHAATAPSKREPDR